MDFNHQRVQALGGKRYVRIPKECRLKTDTVFMYWEGFGVIVAPVSGRFVERERKMAQWAMEHGDDIPPKSPEASP